MTRRLSTLNLSRRSSATSVRSASSYHVRHTNSARHPLSRSYSGGTVYNDVEDGEGVDEWGQRRPRTISTSRSVVPPPTSWHGRGGKNGSGSGSRISTSSAGSSTSGIKTKFSPTPDNGTTSHNSDDTLHTPSTASSLSIPLPSTPQDEILLNGAITRKGRGYDKDKNLPPLPLQPILKKQQSQTGLGGGKIAFPRSRAGSASSSGIPSTPMPTSTTLSRVTSPGPVRPLQLPQRMASVGAGDRPAVPVPVVPPALRNSTSQHGLKATPLLTPSKSVPGLSSSMSRISSAGGISAPSSPINPPTATGLLKPKPRTGTGMAYKKSSYSSLSSSTGPSGAVGGQQQSRIRAPMPLATASLASVSAAAMANGGGKIGGPSGPSGMNALGIRARAKTPVTPKTPSTPIGRAF